LRIADCGLRIEFRSRSRWQSKGSLFGEAGESSILILPDGGTDRPPKFPGTNWSRFLKIRAARNQSAIRDPQFPSALDFTPLGRRIRA